MAFALGLGSQAVAKAKSNPIATIMIVILVIVLITLVGLLIADTTMGIFRKKLPGESCSDDDNCGEGLSCVIDPEDVDGEAMICEVPLAGPSAAELAAAEAAAAAAASAAESPAPSEQAAVSSGQAGVAATAEAASEEAAAAEAARAAEAAAAAQASAAQAAAQAAAEVAAAAVPKANTKYNCMASPWGQYAGMTKNASGDLECFALNGKDCNWSDQPTCQSTLASTNLSDVVPLACGAGHQAHHGSTGYDTDGHWCRTIGSQLGVAAAAAPLGGTDPRTCYNAVQNQIAWDYSGNKSWSDTNINNLCTGNETSTAPAQCFNNVMHGGVNWGGGTQWNWDNALRLCKGAPDPNSRVDCFKSKVGASGWSSAIDQCT